MQDRGSACRQRTLPPKFLAPTLPWCQVLLPSRRPRLSTKPTALAVAVRAVVGNGNRTSQATHGTAARRANPLHYSLLEFDWPLWLLKVSYGDAIWRSPRRLTCFWWFDEAIAPPSCAFLEPETKDIVRLLTDKSRRRLCGWRGISTYTAGADIYSTDIAPILR